MVQEDATQSDQHRSTNFNLIAFINSYWMM